MKSATISRATSGNGTAVVAGIAGKRIYIYGLLVQAAGTANVKLRYSSDGAAFTDLTGPLPEVANSGFERSTSTVPYYILPAGAGLYVNSDAAVQVSGDVQYAVK